MLNMLSHIPGTLEAFHEHILTVIYPHAGRNGLRILGVDALYANNYLSTYATVDAAKDTGTSGTNAAAAVQRVTVSPATLGTPSAIQVTASAGTTHVKITDQSGKPLVLSGASSGVPKVFALNYCFPKAGSQSIRAYAGTMDAATSTILWNKNYKTAKASVTAAAAGATISKVTADRPYRGQPATLTVVTSAKATRVRLFNAKGDIVDFTNVFETVKNTRVFRLNYTEDQAASFKVAVQAGDGIDWNSARKAGTVTFVGPTVTSITSAPALRGTEATIVASATPNAQTAQLLDSGRKLLSTAVKGGDGKFTFKWRQDTAGKKIVYVQVDDGFGSSAMKAATVTFVAPAITKVTAPPALHGTDAVITVSAPATVTKVELSDSKKAPLIEASVRENGDFVIRWSQPTAGKKTVYLRIFDGSWSGYTKATVTFT